MSINWFPGHMVKARREIEANIKLVDIVLILLDARAPFSCRNKELEIISAKKKIIYVLNKIDLALPEVTTAYLDMLRQEHGWAVGIDSISGKGSKEVLQTIMKSYQEQAQKMLDKGRRVRPARIMVAGVPNVGKSTFLNCLVGQKAAKTGNKPGVTRGKQWIRLREDMELLDTPGLMWPKIESEEQGLKLALLNIVGENAYQEETAALYLLRVLVQKWPQVLKNQFKLESIDKEETALLEDIARKRGHLLKGGQLDLEKTCTMLLQDFRKGKLGRFSLD
ncbi:MAG TPA: ribosome biogenesis GTPase YlqF [Syntrophomonadaceae bacterium]|jgi:ribosome biogenesis GTPase A|nr:ribosome biogenesis GTPase YlqF [Syntrophomonadaceae bacterium]HRX21858.1 ribosome biogenesis GTPase YlqF [Syntrophomonadaceae bacterium]